jgi:signal peptidase I
MGQVDESDKFVAISVDRPPRGKSAGKALLALCAAMLLPGLGHLLAGRNWRAAGWFSACLGVTSLLLIVLLLRQLLGAMLLLVPLSLCVYVGQLVDAARCGRRSSRAMLGYPLLRLLLAIVLAVGAFGLDLHFLSLLQGLVVICHTETISMSPTIEPGDWYLSLKRYPVRRWDIVGLTDPYDPSRIDLVKRVVGLPGERVEVTADTLLIDGRPTAPPAGVPVYLPVDRWNRPLHQPDPGLAGAGCWGRPITLGPDEFYALGDHTIDSGDSRLWPPFDGHQAGALPVNKITTRAVAIVWPPRRWRLLP